MEKPSRHPRGASPYAVLVVDVHRHARILRALLEEVPRDGEPREAGAKDGVAERAGASRRRARGGGGGGCDGSSGARAEALEEAGPGRKGRWRLCAVRRRHGFTAPAVDEDAAATVPDRRTAGGGVAALFSAGKE